MITEDHLERAKPTDKTKLRITTKDQTRSVELSDAQLLGRDNQGLTVANDSPQDWYGLIIPRQNSYPGILATQSTDITVVRYNADQTIQAKTEAKPSDDTQLYTDEQLRTYTGRPQPQNLDHGVSHVLIDNTRDDHQAATTRRRIGVTPQCFYHIHRLYEPSPKNTAVRTQNPGVVEPNADLPRPAEDYEQTMNDHPTLDALIQRQ